MGIHFQTVEEGTGGEVFQLPTMIYTAFLMSIEETKVAQFFFFSVLFSFLGANFDIQNRLLSVYKIMIEQRRFKGATGAFLALKAYVTRNFYFCDRFYGFLSRNSSALKEKGLTC